MSPAVDVLVAGAGPAGTALAAVLAERGLSVRIVAPAPDRPWHATYGAWADELSTGPGTGPGSVAEQALALPGTRHWPGVTVGDDGGSRRLARAYVRLDTPGLQAALTARALDAGVTLATGTARGVQHTAVGSTVTLRDGTALTATLVVDASGHRGTLVRRPRADRPSAVQTAYGLVADFSAHPADPGSAVLMDFAADHLPAAERRADPTFLYAMHLGGQRWFVEETSLARRPGMASDVLAARLSARLAARGARPGHVAAVEHVRIPMDTPLPVAAQRVLAVGAAASAVHPATGYLLAATLRAVPHLADALVTGLGGEEASPRRAAALGWAALWPPDRVRARRLHAFGLEALLGMDAPTTRAFFRSFFATRPQDWGPYLSGTQSPAATLALMGRLYAGAPPAVRRQLRGAAVGPHRTALLAALSGRLPRQDAGTDAGTTGAAA